MENEQNMNEQEFWTEQECIKSTKTFEICSRIKV